MISVVKSRQQCIEINTANEEAFLQEKTEYNALSKRAQKLKKEPVMPKTEEVQIEPMQR